MDQSQLIGIAFGIGSLAVLAIVIFIKTNIVICRPNEVVVLSGKKRRTKDGKYIGYRILRGGRGFKMPLVESVNRLPLTTRTVELNLTKVLCSGMIPISIEGRGNVKLAGRVEEGLEQAVERFLEKGIDAVDRTAQQVLEGTLRGVIAGVSPEEANSNRLKLAGDVVTKAREDLHRLGIVLDFFQIQNISDERGYLEAIGRRKNAEILRDAKIAEATAEAESRAVAAEQSRIGREAEIQSQMTIVERENELSVKTSKLNSQASAEKNKADMAGPISKLNEEVKLEDKRVELSAKRQEAETIIPAQARRKALQLEAQGKAARILEEGKATAEAVQNMSKEWAHGKNQELFLLRMFPDLLEMVTKTVADNLRIDKLTILDGGDGNGLPQHVKNVSQSAIVLMEQIKNATGIDLAKMAKGFERGSGPSLPQKK